MKPLAHESFSVILIKKWEKYLLLPIIPSLPPWDNLGKNISKGGIIGKNKFF